MRLHRSLTALLALALGSPLAATARAQAPAAAPAQTAPSLANADWTEPFPPFRIAGKL